MIAILIMYQMIVPVSSELVYLENVDCGAYQDYVKTDSLGYFRYTPYYVKLSRCRGGNIVPNILSKQCVPTIKKDVDLYVYYYENGTSTTLKLTNHTFCEEKCAINASSCTPYETFNAQDCMCMCNYVGTPSPNPCKYPFYWDQSRCDCTCSLETQVCEKRKEFSKEFCGCVCKHKFHVRCAKRKLVVDRETCECKEPTIRTGKSTSDCEGSVTVGILVLVMVLEAIIIIILYFFLYVYCYRRKYLGRKLEKENLVNGEHLGHNADNLAMSRSIVLDSHPSLLVNDINKNDNNNDIRESTETQQDVNDSHKSPNGYANNKSPHESVGRSIGEYLGDDLQIDASPKDKKSLIDDDDDCYEPGVGYVSGESGNYRCVSLV